MPSAVASLPSVALNVSSAIACLHIEAAIEMVSTASAESDAIITTADVRPLAIAPSPVLLSVWLGTTLHAVLLRQQLRYGWNHWKKFISHCSAMPSCGCDCHKPCVPAPAEPAPLPFKRAPRARKQRPLPPHFLTLRDVQILPIVPSVVSQRSRACLQSELPVHSSQRAQPANLNMYRRRQAAHVTASVHSTTKYLQRKSEENVNVLK